MPRRGPGILVAGFVVLPDRLHERREQAVAPAADRSLDASGDEARAVLEDPHEFVGQLHQRAAEVAAGLRAIGEQEDRNAGLTLPDVPEQLHRAAFLQFLEFHVGGHEKCVEVHVRRGYGKRLADAPRELDADLPVGKRLGQPRDGAVQSMVVFGKDVLHDEDLSGLQFDIVHDVRPSFFVYAAVKMNGIRA